MGAILNLGACTLVREVVHTEQAAIVRDYR